MPRVFNWAMVHCPKAASSTVSEGTYDVWGPKEQSDYCEMIEWAGTRD